MTGIVVDIMVEVLMILGTATKEMKRGLLSELMLCQFTVLGLTDTTAQESI